MHSICLYRKKQTEEEINMPSIRFHGSRYDEEMQIIMRHVIATRTPFFTWLEKKRSS